MNSNANTSIGSPPASNNSAPGSPQHALSTRGLCGTGVAWSVGQGIARRSQRRACIAEAGARSQFDLGAQKASAHGRHLLIERITNAPSAPFPRELREAWWPVPPTDTSEQSWQADLALLDDYQAKFSSAARAATPAQLSTESHRVLSIRCAINCLAWARTTRTTPDRSGCSPFYKGAWT